MSFYLKEPSYDSLPKGILPGDVLKGSITYLKKDNSTLGCGTKPGGYELRYLVADTKPPSDKNTTDKSSNNSGDKGGNSEKKDNGSKKEEKQENGLDIAIREAKVKYFKSQLGTSDAITVFENLYPIAVKEHPTDLSLVQVGLSHRNKSKTQALTKIPKTRPLLTVADGSFVDVLIATDLVVDAATAVNALIDVDVVARDLGEGIFLYILLHVVVQSYALYLLLSRTYSLSLSLTHCHISPEPSPAAIIIRLLKGMNVDKDDTAAVATRKEMETKKQGL